MRLLRLVAVPASIIAGSFGGYFSAAAASTTQAAASCGLFANTPVSDGMAVQATQGRQGCSGGTVVGTSQLRRSKPFQQDATDVKLSWSAVNITQSPREACGTHGHGTYYGSVHGGGDLDGPHQAEC